MWTVLTCIRDDHDLRLVGLAAVVCLLAAGTSLRFHDSSLREDGRSRAMLNLCIGLTAGGGVWATHFIAMLAYSSGVPLSFDVGVTVASLLLAIVGMGCGFALASAEARPLRLCLAGCMIGLSIVGMHFTGIAAIRSTFAIEWSGGYVAASVLAAVAGATAALFAVRRWRGWRGWTLPTLCLVGGIVGLHFTAMAAIQLVPDLTAPAVHNAIDRPGVAVLTGVVALLVISAGAAMGIILAQSRRSGFRNMEAAFGGLPLGLAMFDRAGCLILWNAAFERLLGQMSVVPAKGMTRRDLLAQELKASGGQLDDQLGEWIEAIHAGRSGGLAREWQTLDGAWLRMEISALPSGESVTVVSDITQSRTYTAAMAEARDRAEAANRAKSDFLANMSHEIRTPLNGILGMAQVMNQDALSTAQKGRLRVIKESGASLLVILNDLLDLAKIQAGKLELELAEVDMARLVRSVGATFEGLASTKDVALSVEVEDDARGLWRVDESRVRQVLGNLVGNAVKFTHDGEVRLTLQIAGDGALVVAVEDNGIGIAAEDIPSLFDKFTQADATTTRRYGGTGLGLAISRELAELMGAKITVSSEVGRGSCFTLTLPAEQISTDCGDDAAEQELCATPEQPLRILAAEDNPTNQLVLRAMLQAAPCELVVVDDGLAAVEAAAGGAFDVILMDVQMPGMNGIEATKAIRAAERQGRTGRTPIIALTANVMRHQTDEYLAVGMDSWVAKPIEMDKLFASLEAVLTADERAAA